MRANTDRATGVQLVTDSPHVRPAAETTVDLVEAGLTYEDFVPAGLRVVTARTSYPFHVQLLLDDEGCTYVTCVLDGQYETFEVERDKAHDAFLHPFAYGATLPL